MMPVESGHKALSNLSEQPRLHTIGRKPYVDALSPKGVLELQPFLETVIKGKIRKLEDLARSGEVGARVLMMVRV